MGKKQMKRNSGVLGIFFFKTHRNHSHPPPSPKKKREGEFGNVVDISLTMFIILVYDYFDCDTIA